MLLPSRIRVPAIPGQSRVVSYRLRIARLCSLALCDRRSLKTLINRFQLHYLPEGGLKSRQGFISMRVILNGEHALPILRTERARVKGENPSILALVFLCRYFNFVILSMARIARNEIRHRADEIHCVDEIST